MGYWKELYTEIQEGKPYPLFDRFVCSGCVVDPGLRTYIMSHRVDDGRCSYCLSSDAVADVYDFILYIYDCICKEWSECQNRMPYDEGEYVFSNCDTYDLFDYEIPDITHNDILLNDIISSIGYRNWCSTEWWRLREHEYLKSGYEQLASDLKSQGCSDIGAHEQMLPDDYDDSLPSDQVLEKIEEIILSEGRLHYVLDPHAIIYRVVKHCCSEDYNTAALLGAPPKHICTQPNRMSPAGKPMFYAALDENTCIQETVDVNMPTSCYTIGSFRTIEPMILLDLSDIPSCPTIFEIDSWRREPLKFMRWFAHEISRPIPHDGLEHIEYRPTQEFAKKVRDEIKLPNGAHFDGIIYTSSKNTLGKCCVLFINNEQSVGKERSDIYRLCYRNMVENASSSNTVCGNCGTRQLVFDCFLDDSSENRLTPTITTVECPDIPTDGSASNNTMMKTEDLNDAVLKIRLLLVGSHTVPISTQTIQEG